ncbi:unnamed protein product [Darwinula stevensoni]|uniref:Vacuolar protein sorting-associated protein 26C n=1 Tax=Darwinula stevensoni TaxID=69355 RepID=A0A7R9ACM2_9CRUS|nr:unnamed protein product [Darwinula stevensoni]CAG0900444.1 unnamed protein product [Darwinula stevensoni]
MTLALDIRLKRVSKVYREGDLVTGLIVIQCKNEVRHGGIFLALDGDVNLQLSARSVGIFEAFYNSVKPISLISYSLEVSKPGKLSAGVTEIPFEFPLKVSANKKLYETYHGVFVNIQYMLRCEVKKGMLAKDTVKTAEFIVEYKEHAEAAVKKPVEFTITPDSLSNVKDKSRIPSFKVRGKIDSTCCCITKPFTGELVIEECDMPIKSVELQLVRVETCGCAEGYAKDATEVQNIQIGEGDVMRGLPFPIHMVFPRLFTCPTLVTANFKVEFEVNIVVIFNDDHLITENFPIKLTRF